MKELLLEKKYGFVFDIQHAYMNDHSMELAEEFVKELSSRISHIHLSGFKKHKDNQPHSLLLQTQRELILNHVPTNVPIIIESALQEHESLEDLGKELDYIKRHLL